MRPAGCIVCLNSRRLLEWAAGRAAKTRATEVGELLLSMLRGETGNQNREITELIGWLREQAKPDVICLSNALLIGMVRRLKAELGVPVVCLLQGEEPYLDALPPDLRPVVWQLLAERAADVDAWIAPSRWNAEAMKRRLNLNPERLHVVHNGINLAGYAVEGPKARGPRASARRCSVISRACARTRGWIRWWRRTSSSSNAGSVPRLKLHIGGGCGPGDEPFVKSLRVRLAASWLHRRSRFQPESESRGETGVSSGADGVFRPGELWRGLWPLRH